MFDLSKESIFFLFKYIIRVNKYLLIWIVLGRGEMWGRDIRVGNGEGKGKAVERGLGFIDNGEKFFVVLCGKGIR